MISLKNGVYAFWGHTRACALVSTIGYSTAIEYENEFIKFT